MDEDDFIDKHLIYLNTFELSRLADRYDIPYHIYAEDIDGHIKKTSSKESKYDIIKRLKKFYFKNKISQPTVYPHEVISYIEPNSPTEKTKIYYGASLFNDKKIIKIMKSLTDNKFRHGPVSATLLRKCWASGVTPSLKEFAGLWLKSIDNYETDSHLKKKWIKNWKKYRDSIAIDVIKIFHNKLKT